LFLIFIPLFKSVKTSNHEDKLVNVLFHYAPVKRFIVHLLTVSI
jgi:hypothetical protein